MKLRSRNFILNSALQWIVKGSNTQIDYSSNYYLAGFFLSRNSCRFTKTTSKYLLSTQIRLFIPGWSQLRFTWTSRDVSWCWNADSAGKGECSDSSMKQRTEVKPIEYSSAEYAALYGALKWEEYELLSDWSDRRETYSLLFSEQQIWKYNC